MRDVGAAEQTIGLHRSSFASSFFFLLSELCVGDEIFFLSCFPLCKNLNLRAYTWMEKKARIRANSTVSIIENSTETRSRRVFAKASTSKKLPPGGDRHTYTAIYMLSKAVRLNALRTRETSSCHILRLFLSLKRVRRCAKEILLYMYTIYDAMRSGIF